MRTVASFVLFASCSGVAATPAWAQAAHDASVEVALTANPDDWHRTPARRATGLSIGLDKGRARFEFTRPSWHHVDSRTVHAGTVSTRNERRRTLSLDALYVRHYQVRRRLTLSWLAGGGYAVRAWHTTNRTERTLPTGEIVIANKQELGRRDHFSGVGGVDADVTVTPHIAIVPQLRFHIYPIGSLDDSCCGTDLITAEPRIAVRWRF